MEAGWYKILGSYEFKGTLTSHRHLEFSSQRLLVRTTGIKLNEGAVECGLQLKG